MSEVEALPTLLDLLTRYRAENPSDCCARLDSVIEVIRQLREETRLQFEKYDASRPVVDATDEEEEGDGEQRKTKKENPFPRAVLWYDTPIVYWLEPTYAIFMVSFLTTFFNPQCGIGAHTAITDDNMAIKQVQSQLGRLLKFIHREAAPIAAYFDVIWRHGDYTALDWRTAAPYRVFERVVTVWNAVLRQCNEKGNDKDEKARLMECVINSDVALLQKGLGVPLLLAHMVMHYQVIRLNCLTETLIQEGRGENEEKEEDNASEHDK